MYCQGTPKIFTIKARDRIVHARYSNDHKYLATVTSSAVYIWSTHQVSSLFTVMNKIEKNIY